MKICIVGYDQTTDFVLSVVKNLCKYEVIGFIRNAAGNSLEHGLAHERSNYFEHLSEIVALQKPDAVFIFSTSDVNYAIAMEALGLGCSVFISSPYRLSSENIRNLYLVASEKGLALELLHPYLYDHELVKYLNKITALSGNAERKVMVNIRRKEKLASLRKYTAPNVISEEYGYPGGVFHKDVYYALFVILDAVGPVSGFSVHESSSGVLPQNLSDNIEIICNGKYGIGIINVCYANRPELFQIRTIENGVEMDIRLDAMASEIGMASSNTLISRTRRLLDRLLPGANFHGSIAAQLCSANKGFITNSDHEVRSESVLAVFDLANQLWAMVKNKSLNFSERIPSYTSDKMLKPRVLVTGASGSLGKVLINKLGMEGYRVRALVRKLSANTALAENNVEIFYGDVSDIASLEEAVRGVDYVVHAAADTLATDIGTDTSTINGTRNIVALCHKYNVKNLVYISTCNVYGVAGYESGYHITENSPLEIHPERRGSYTYTKLAAERLVQDEMRKGSINAVCIRPGTYFGQGIEYFTPLIGFSLKSRLFITIGHQSLVLPLVCVENVADAISAILNNNSCKGKTYNLIDDNAVTKIEYVDNFIKKLFPAAIFVHIPFGLLCFIIGIQERFFSLIHIKPLLTQYRFISSQNNVIYESMEINKDLHWKSPYSIRERMEAIRQLEDSKIKKECKA